MEENNIGILFTGTVGTGKSFYACSIANALIEKLVTAQVTSLPRILNSIQSMSSDKQDYIDRLQRPRLLVIDDIGTERSTEYALEQVSNVIDTRLRSKRPTIFTTNLTIEQMETATSQDLQRIYDRVLQMCPIRLTMTGVSRRREDSNYRTQVARNILNSVTKEEG